jgi:recombination protein RecA
MGDSASTSRRFMAKGKKDDSNKEGQTKVSRDEMVASLVSALNKSQKDGVKVAYFLDEQDDPSTVKDWISTGSTLLDVAISNRVNGGLPCGRLVELNGLEGTGKSLIAAHIIANTQKKGGIAVMIDTENAAAPDFWAAVGVDIPNLPYVHASTVEDIFNRLEFMIGHVRKTDPDRLVAFVVDSVAGASTEKEMEADHGVTGYNTGKSIMISAAMRKLTGLIGDQKILVVFTNQLRMNLAATMPGQDRYITSGGKALAYACSVRVRLKSIGKLKNSDKETIGVTCKAIVEKNRMGPPQRTAEFEIMFDSGISDMKSWWMFCKEKKLFDVGISAPVFLKRINEEPDFKKDIYNKICEKYIMLYKSPNSTIEENLEEVDPEADELTTSKDED